MRRAFLIVVAALTSLSVLSAPAFAAEVDQAPFESQLTAAAQAMVAGTAGQALATHMEVTMAALGGISVTVDAVTNPDGSMLGGVSSGKERQRNLCVSARKCWSKDLGRKSDGKWHRVDTSKSTSTDVALDASDIVKLMVPSDPAVTAVYDVTGDTFTSTANVSGGSYTATQVSAMTLTPTSMDVTVTQTVEGESMSATRISSTVTTPVRIKAPRKSQLAGRQPLLPSARAV